MASTPLIGYADCFSGISGDMFLGALLHCGLPQELLEKDLAKLGIDDFDLKVSSRKINGIDSFKVDVIGQPQQDFRHLSSILEILETAELPVSIIDKSRDVFVELARAEAKVHNIDIDKIHFHEVGAIDTIVDIVGTVIGLYHLGVGRLVTSPIPSPHGFIKCDHGTLPLPAPAVCEILQGVPCCGIDMKHELVTPTGAALIKVLSDDFGTMPPMTIKTTGYGAGSHTLPNNHPNLFRLILGEAASVNEHQQVEVIETNIDDWSPEGFPHLFELLFSQGALDVSLQPIQMKKGRPGFKLQVISSPAHSQILKKTIFCETSAIGLRHHTVQRQTLPREMIEVDTPWGRILAKKVVTPDGDRIYPEYEECRKIATEHNVALQLVYNAVTKGKQNQ
jgi:uncharacterized protein (TIGR00299 family) protein